MSLESCKKCGAQLSTSDMFCSKCGTQRIPQNNTSHVRSKGFSKKTKVGMGVAIVIGTFIILVGVGGSLNQQQTETPSDETKKKYDRIFTGNLTELLPTRSDLGTEWVFPRELEVRDDAGDPYDKAGYFDGLSRGHTKMGGGSVKLFIYRFVTHENASKFYNDSVEESIRKGGYEEVSLYKMPADDCYGKFIEGWLTVKTTVYCIKKNIVVFSISRGDYENEVIENAGKFAKSVIEKVV